jgi:hypothetical protein
MTRKLAQEFGTESVAFATTSKSDEIDGIWPLAFPRGGVLVHRPDTPRVVVVKRRASSEEVMYHSETVAGDPGDGFYEAYIRRPQLLDLAHRLSG